MKGRTGVSVKEDLLGGQTLNLRVRVGRKACEEVKDGGSLQAERAVQLRGQWGKLNRF